MADGSAAGAKTTPPSLAGGGCGEGSNREIRMYSTPPPNPLPQGEGECHRVAPLPRHVRSFRLNGQDHDALVADNVLLLDYLRDTLGLTGTKQGCDGGECGACTVLIDGRPRLACLTRASECAGRDVETIEGLADGGRPSKLQRAFHEKLGTQCGYCTPGMVMAAEALLRRNPDPDEAAIRAALAGNICRCTGYVKIIEAVRAAAGGTR